MKKTESRLHLLETVENRERLLYARQMTKTRRRHEQQIATVRKPLKKRLRVIERILVRASRLQVPKLPDFQLARARTPDGIRNVHEVRKKPAGVSARRQP
jgi:hypothetical protein